MSRIQCRAWAAAVLAAELLALSACTGPVSSTPPVESSPAGQTSEITPSPQQNVDKPENSHPPAVISVEPSPTVGPSPTPASSVTDKVTGLMGLCEEVEEGWFADAVFVGDSRTDGLRLYSGIRGASFISHQGLSVFNIESKECIEQDGVKITALDALGRQEYAKVYLMLGVNELGYGAESFRDAYAALVDHIMEIQPNASIYLQTVLPVNEPIAASHNINAAITNERVKRFNSIIVEIAEEKNTALVDVAELFWNEKGEMAKENTSDGVHLTRKGYVAWFEYLKSHTGTTEPVPSDPSADGGPQPDQSGAPAAGDPDPVQSDVLAAGDPEPAQSGAPAAGDPDPVQSDVLAAGDPEPVQSEGAQFSQTTAGDGRP